MGDNNTSNSDPKEQDSKGEDPKGQEPTSGGQEPSEPQNKSPLSREALESIVVDLRKENAESRVKLKKFEDEQKQLEQERKKEAEAKEAEKQQQLKEQGKWQEIAEQKDSRVQELEPVKERFTNLETLIAEQIESQIKDWPADAKLFDPGKDAPIEQRLEWMNKARKLAEKLQQKSAQPGNSPNPKPAPGIPQTTVETTMDKIRPTGAYGKF